MDQKFAGIWVMAIAEGKRYLGRLVGFTSARAEDSWSIPPGAPFAKLEPESIGSIYRAVGIELYPVLDYVSIDQPVSKIDASGRQVLGFNRTPVVMPFDYTRHDATLYLKPSALMFLGSMHEEDEALYMGFIAQALKERDAPKNDPAKSLILPTGPLSPFPPARR